MPIKSYLAHAHGGQKEKLINALSELHDCEVTPSENQDILVLVTDTPDDISDDILKKKIEDIDSLKILTLVSGFNNPSN